MTDGGVCFAGRFPWKPASAVLSPGHSCRGVRRGRPTPPHSLLSGVRAGYRFLGGVLSLTRSRCQQNRCPPLTPPPSKPLAKFRTSGSDGVRLHSCTCVCLFTPLFNTDCHHRFYSEARQSSRSETSDEWRWTLKATSLLLPLLPAFSAMFTSPLISSCLIF